MQRPLTQRPPDTSWSVGHQKWAESPKLAFPSWAKAIGGLRAKGAELSNLVFPKDLLIPTLYVKGAESNMLSVSYLLTFTVLQNKYFIL